MTPRPCACGGLVAVSSEPRGRLHVGTVRCEVCGAHAAADGTTSADAECEAIDAWDAGPDAEPLPRDADHPLAPVDPPEYAAFESETLARRARRTAWAA